MVSSYSHPCPLIVLELVLVLTTNLFSGNCFFCDRNQTGRCTKSRVFGSVPLDGAQAEYVLVPLADTTLYHLPKDVPPEIMLLCADIFPTGYFVANNAWNMLNEAERKVSLAFGAYSSFFQAH